MASTDILLGRGVVSIGGDDCGLCSALTLRHDVDAREIATFDSVNSGGANEVAIRSRVYADMTLHELTSNNRAKLLDLARSRTAVAIAWAGKNVMAADCSTSNWTLSATGFVLPTPALALIAPDLSAAAVELTVILRRAAAATTWYTLSVA